MRSQISEFSYGYALTQELVIDMDKELIQAPIFPSLVEEGREGGGYDLALRRRRGIPLFIQFKLTECLTRRNAIEIQNGHILNCPFYRLHLRPLKYSEQHSLLLELDNGINEVYYVGPAFYQQEEFDRHYFNRSIIQNSIFIKPSEVGTLPDRNEHHITFVPTNMNIWHLFSKEPKEMQGDISKNKFEDSIRMKMERNQNDIATNVRIELPKMISTAQKYYKTSSQFNDLLVSDEIDPLKRATYLTRFYYGCELFFLLDRTQGENSEIERDLL